MKPRLLLVDDNRAILFAMREYFAERGYRVSCACTKNEAETLLAEHTYTALITDLRLTGSASIEGLEIATNALRRCPSICSILLTAYDSPETRRAAYERGIDICLPKPTPLDEISERVSELRLLKPREVAKPESRQKSPAENVAAR